MENKSDSNNDDDDDDDNNNNNNNNNNISVTYKYWVGVQRGIAVSHEKVELFSLG